jgi:putative spermidine/putrescine transport system substrate-binding protein
MNRFAADSALIALEKFHKGAIDRRSLMKALGALGLVAAIRPSRAFAQASEIVVCNWGGAAVDAFQEAFGAPFTEKSGIPVVIDGAGPAIGSIRAMVESGAVTWDATDGGMVDAVVLGAGGYATPIDYTIVDRTKVSEGFAAEFGVGNYTFSNVLAYNAAEVGAAPPAGWVDFFDTAKFPGKRTMCKWIQGQLETALIADGVAPADLYPLDVDRAFEKIRPLLPDLIFWEGGAESQQLFRDGEVVMGNIWHTRANLLHKENADYTWTWNENVLLASAWSVPKGNPAGPAVFEFIDSSLDPEGQITLLRLMGNGPTNPAALALMTEEDLAVYPLAPANAENNIPLQAAWYAENEADVQNRFLDFISS